MERMTTRKRPWLAAMLSVLATGLGHLYLRRWKRALGWLATLYVVAVLFVPSSVLDTLFTGGPVDLLAAAPVLLVSGLCVLDAYLLAHVQNTFERLVTIEVSQPTESDAEAVRCPSCGRALDADLDFCHWCTTQLDGDGSATDGPHAN